MCFLNQFKLLSESWTEILWSHLFSDAHLLGNKVIQFCFFVVFFQIELFSLSDIHNLQTKIKLKKKVIAVSSIWVNCSLSNTSVSHVKPRNFLWTFSLSSNFFSLKSPKISSYESIKYWLNYKLISSKMVFYFLNQ